MTSGSHASSVSPVANGPGATQSVAPAAATGVAGKVAVSVELTVQGIRLRSTVHVSNEPTKPQRLLPILQTLTDTIVNISVQECASNGRPLSCKAGCGACCKQLVPVSRSEARRLAEVVDAMPPQRREIVQRRFAEARQRLEAAGMLDRLSDSESIGPDEMRPVAEEYFRVGIPCPFLEDGSCSIYPDRPLICREFIVSSDPIHCQDATGQNVERIEVPGKLGAAAARWDRATLRTCDDQTLPWIPLALALEWASTHPQETQTSTGPEQLQAMMSSLTAHAVAITDEVSPRCVGSESPLRSGPRRNHA